MLCKLDQLDSSACKASGTWKVAGATSASVIIQFSLLQMTCRLIILKDSLKMFKNMLTIRLLDVLSCVEYETDNFCCQSTG